MKKIFWLCAALWLIPQTLQAAPPAPPKPPTPATSQPVTKEIVPPLYTIDSPAMPKAKEGSKLARVLKSQVLRACVRSDVPPFGYFLGQQLVGFDVDLVGHIARRLSTYYKRNITVDWTVVNAGSRISSIQQDSCDLVAAAFSYTDARAKLVSFSKIYLKTGKVLVAAKQISHKKPIVALVRGTTHANAKEIANAEIRLFHNYKEIIYAMESGEVDYVVTDRPIALHMIRSVSKAYEIVKSIGKQEEYAIGFGLKNKSLREAVNQALSDIAQAGTLAFLQRQWL